MLFLIHILFNNSSDFRIKKILDVVIKIKWFDSLEKALHTRLHNEVYSYSKVLLLLSNGHFI